MSLRWRLGTAKLALAHALRRPMRHRWPFFSPQRECKRLLERHAAILAGQMEQIEDWETHAPVLIELLTQDRQARVLELGSGYGSTPLVLGLSGSSVSVETSPAWFRRFARFDSPAHRVVLWEQYSDFDWGNCPYFEQDWDIAFIDNSPGQSRQSLVKRLENRARIIVCHDTQECFGPSSSDFRWDFAGFKHVWTYTQFGTYTTVVSNLDPVPLDHLPGIHGLPARPASRHHSC